MRKRDRQGLDLHFHVTIAIMSERIDTDRRGPGAQPQARCATCSRAKGYRTLETETAEEGLDLAREHKPDLVLMDIQLPGINGIEALVRLRADPSTRGDPRHRGHGLGHAAEPTADPGGRLRRVSAQADQRQGVSGGGATGARPIRRRARRFLTGPFLRARSKLTGSTETARMSDRAKILVVDDTPQNVKLLADLLGAKGYDVVTASSGSAGARAGREGATRSGASGRGHARR